jgi:2-polyprenyl-3-methyl-5-hydroxy-6-metoxy-1,4-benzoquinol methylase
MEEAFQDIFNNRTWGTNLDNRPSSGPASWVKIAQPFSEWLFTDFLPRNSIQSIIDIGCGDWQYMRNVDLNEFKYIGVDCVKDIVTYNSRVFGKKNIEFIQNDCLDVTGLPNGDLYIIKDVLQHWTTEHVTNFLRDCIAQRKCRFIVIVNDYQQDSAGHDVKHIGDTRPLNAQMLPLKAFDPEIIKCYGSKQISVIHV